MVSKLDIVDTMVPCEPYTARDIAEELDIPRRTAGYHLRNLASDGRIYRKEHSQRNITYWVE